MRVLAAITLTIFLCAFSCEDTEDINIDGTYTGEFFRLDPKQSHDVSNVTLTLSDGKFQGTSSAPKYPAICKGTYSVDGRDVTFKDACYWTADFDWSFILSGEFNVSGGKDSLVMSAPRGDGVRDVYRLRRQRQ